MFIFTEVSALVLSQNIGNLTNLLRSHHVLVSVLRLKAQDSRSRPGLVRLLVIKKSQSWTCPFVNFSRNLILGLVTKYWSSISFSFFKPALTGHVTCCLWLLCYSLLGNWGFKF